MSIIFISIEIQIQFLQYIYFILWNHSILDSLYYWLSFTVYSLQFLLSCYINNIVVHMNTWSELSTSCHFHFHSRLSVIIITCFYERGKENPVKSSTRRSQVCILDILCTMYYILHGSDMHNYRFMQLQINSHWQFPIDNTQCSSCPLSFFHCILFFFLLHPHNYNDIKLLVIIQFVLFV